MTSPLHIALFCRSLTGSGPGRMQVNLARTFADRGYTVDLLLADAVGPYLQEVPATVRVVSLKGMWALRYLPRVFTDRDIVRILSPVLCDIRAPRVVYALPALIGYLREVRPHALLSAQHYGNVAALCAVRLAGVATRLVITQRTHLSQYIRSARKRRQRNVLTPITHCYPWADEIVAVSHGVADDLADMTGLRRDRIHTIYNPVVTPDLLRKAREPVSHPWFEAGAPPVVLAAGRLHYQKDFPTLMRAFASVHRERPVRLMILGEGEERPELERLVHTLGLGASVALPGFVNNPFAYMSRATVFALSSAYEGLPGVLIQSLACGCPVISTDCPSGPAEILDYGRYGTLIPVGDQGALTRALVEALDRPRDQEQLRQRAAMFSVDYAADRYLDILCTQTMSHIYTPTNRSPDTRLMPSGTLNESL